MCLIAPALQVFYFLLNCWMYPFTDDATVYVILSTISKKKKKSKIKIKIKNK